MKLLLLSASFKSIGLTVIGSGWDVAENGSTFPFGKSGAGGGTRVGFPFANGGTMLR